MKKYSYSEPVMEIISLENTDIVCNSADNDVEWNDEGNWSDYYSLDE